MELFEKALRNKLRFEGSGQGLLSTEDLFDLSLTSLDKMAKAVNKLLRDEGEDSFIPTATPKRATHNDLRLEILKHIISVKVAAEETRKNRADTLARISTLKTLAEAKANEQLASQSLEDIQKQLAELSASLA